MNPGQYKDNSVTMSMGRWCIVISGRGGDHPGHGSSSHSGSDNGCGGDTGRSSTGCSGSGSSGSGSAGRACAGSPGTSPGSTRACPAGSTSSTAFSRGMGGGNRCKGKKKRSSNEYGKYFLQFNTPLSFQKQ